MVQGSIYTIFCPLLMPPLSQEPWKSSDSVLFIIHRTLGACQLHYCKVIGQDQNRLLYILNNTSLQVAEVVAMVLLHANVNDNMVDLEQDRGTFLSGLIDGFVNGKHTWDFMRSSTVVLFNITTIISSPVTNLDSLDHY